MIGPPIRLAAIGVAFAILLSPWVAGADCEALLGDNGRHEYVQFVMEPEPAIRAERERLLRAVDECHDSRPYLQLAALQDACLFRTSVRHDLNDDCSVTIEGKRLAAPSEVYRDGLARYPDDPRIVGTWMMEDAEEIRLSRTFSRVSSTQERADRLAAALAKVAPEDGPLPADEFLLYSVATVLKAQGSPRALDAARALTVRAPELLNGHALIFGVLAATRDAAAAVDSVIAWLPKPPTAMYGVRGQRWRRGPIEKDTRADLALIDDAAYMAIRNHWAPRALLLASYSLEDAARRRGAGKHLAVRLRDILPRGKSARQALVEQAIGADCRASVRDAAEDLAGLRRARACDRKSGGPSTLQRLCH